MNKQYFMTDQVKPKDKMSFPGKDLLLMSTGLFFATIIVLSAIIVLSVSTFYIK